VARLDRRHAVALLTLQDPAAEPLLAGVPAAERLASVRLAEPNGALLERGPAVVGLLRRLGLPLPRAAGPWLTPLYDTVSSRRGTLAGLGPNGPAPRDFP
jgi:hypothetical protein